MNLTVIPIEAILWNKIPANEMHKSHIAQHLVEEVLESGKSGAAGSIPATGELARVAEFEGDQCTKLSRFRGVLVTVCDLLTH